MLPLGIPVEQAWLGNLWPFMCCWTAAAITLEYNSIWRTTGPPSLPQRPLGKVFMSQWEGCLLLKKKYLTLPTFGKSEGGWITP